MRNKVIIGGRRVAITTLALVSMACQSAQPFKLLRQSMDMKKFEKTKQRCVGRFAIDLPEEFVLNTIGAQEIDGVSLKVAATPLGNFNLRLAARRAELEKGTTRGETQQYPMLRRIIPLPGGAKGAVFDRAESAVKGGRLSRELELMGWRDGYIITGSLRATDTTFAEDANDKLVQNNLKTDVPAKLANLLNVFARTRGRIDQEIPEQQGVCILNGFVIGPPSPRENVLVHYHLSTADDVYFTFLSTSTHGEDGTLLDRLKDIQPVLNANNGRVVRQGRRDINGMLAHEVGFAMLGDPDDQGNREMFNQFLLEANTKLGNAQFPFLTIELENGQRKPDTEAKTKALQGKPVHKATLSEAEASALWDVVIPTVRRFSTAF